VNEYRGAMQAGKDLLSSGGLAGQKLYSMLLAPAIGLIPRNSHLIVLPDAKLYRLNFETLIAPEPTPHYWIEDVVVDTASSLTLLDSASAAQPVRQKRLLLIGNAEPNKDFPALPQAAQEMRNIEKDFPESKREVLEGKEATAAAYLHSSPERFSYIHFVTHGTASVTHPLESAVILSKEGDSYKLYARDIVQHHLNANLVTISACDTSGKRNISGEGLVGLTWAFLRAGAHNVIGALWEVSDASTPQLMDTLYGELSQGKDPATALRDAKLSLLHSNDPRSVFKKPFYWAPFQLYTGS
jgi:CHAT domain-containing protein